MAALETLKSGGSIVIISKELILLCASPSLPSSSPSLLLSSLVLEGTDVWVQCQRPRHRESRHSSARHAWHHYRRHGGGAHALPPLKFRPSPRGLPCVSNFHFLHLSSVGVFPPRASWASRQHTSGVLPGSWKNFPSSIFCL